MESASGSHRVRRSSKNRVILIKWWLIGVSRLFGVGTEELKGKCRKYAKYGEGEMS